MPTFYCPRPRTLYADTFMPIVGSLTLLGQLTLVQHCPTPTTHHTHTHTPSPTPSPPPLQYCACTCLPFPCMPNVAYTLDLVDLVRLPQRTIPPAVATLAAYPCYRTATTHMQAMLVFSIAFPT